MQKLLLWLLQYLLIYVDILEIYVYIYIKNDVEKKLEYDRRKEILDEIVGSRIAGNISNTRIENIPIAYL